TAAVLACMDRLDDEMPPVTGIVAVRFHRCASLGSPYDRDGLPAKLVDGIPVHLGVRRIHCREPHVGGGAEADSPTCVLEDSLPLTKLFLRIPLRGDVAEHEDDAAHPTIVVTDWSTAVGNRAARAVLRDEDRVVGEAYDHALANHPRHGALDERPCLLVL